MIYRHLFRIDIQHEFTLIDEDAKNFHLGVEKVCQSLENSSHFKKRFS
jgi:hypothetical protein